MDVLPACMSVQHLGAYAYRGQNWIRDGCRHTCGCWAVNPCTLEEKPVFLTTELSDHIFKKQTNKNVCSNSQRLNFFLVCLTITSACQIYVEFVYILFFLPSNTERTQLLFHFQIIFRIFLIISKEHVCSCSHLLYSEVYTNLHF